MNSTTIQLKRSTPEAHGIPSTALIDFLAEAEKNIHSLHSFMLLRHGEVVSEGWWYPWRASTPHMLFSLSKSFTSTAVGIAVAEGLLRVDDQMITFFPNDAPKKASPNLAAMKVYHLLTMSTGHDQDTSERIFSAKNPIRKFLSLPVEHTPGTHFVYNSGASFMLAAILYILTGQTLTEYLNPRLFEPLGITEFTWDSHPSGINYGGWGLNIKTEDIARFGQLYLQKGRWNGRNILSPSWIEEATKSQVSNGVDPESDWTQGYGYQFWRCRYNCFRGDGAFGQFCLVMPDQEAVLAITAGVLDMQAVLNLVWEKLLPYMGSQRLLEDSPANNSLRQILESLTVPPPRGAHNTQLSRSVSDKTYTFEPNYETLKSLRFNFSDDRTVMTCQLLGGGKRRGIHSLSIGNGNWMEGISYIGGLAPQLVTASGVWSSPNTYTVTLCNYETPFTLTLTCRFEGNSLFYNCEPNMSFKPIEYPQLIGVLE